MVLKRIFFIVFVVVVAKGFDVQLPQEQQRPQQQPQHQPQQQPQQQPHQQEEQQADALEQVVVVGVEPDAQAQNGGAAEQVEVILQNSRRHRLINKKMFFCLFVKPFGQAQAEPEEEEEELDAELILEAERYYPFDNFVHAYLVMAIRGSVKPIVRGPLWLEKNKFNK